MAALYGGAGTLALFSTPALSAAGRTNLVFWQTVVALTSNIVITLFTCGGSLYFYTFTTYMQKLLALSGGMSVPTVSLIMTACLLCFVLAVSLPSLHTGPAFALAILVAVAVQLTVFLARRRLARARLAESP